MLTIASASATDIDVGGNGSDYTTVSEAVSNSQSGDNIYIETGNYNENNININHDLTISSKNSGNILTCIDPLTGLDIGYNVNVLPTIVAKSIVKTYLNDTQFHATLLDEKGNPVTNTNITFNIHGVFYKKLTNESGIATLNIRLIPGEYILTAYDPFNGLDMGYNITVLEKD